MPARSMLTTDTQCRTVNCSISASTDITGLESLLVLSYCCLGCEYHYLTM
uniref:Uncharacterized protein n=1 Tax=Rhizophora mucronata TaxID=61149 RepID=A0A2P2N340_RHIMU